MGFPARVVERIATQVKRYQQVIEDAKKRDISESDTVAIISDMLSDVLGYKKYDEVTTEYAIRGTFADLAIAVDKKVRLLIEAKAIGTELRDNHIRQVVDYCANSGVEWALLTNAAHWRLYRVKFTQPIDKVVVHDLSLLGASPKSDEVLELFGCLSREVFSADAMEEMFTHKQAMSRYTIASLLLTDNILAFLRRELRQLAPGLQVEGEAIRKCLEADVIKRDVLEGEESKTAAAAWKKLNRQRAKKKADKPATADAGAEPQG